MTRLQLLRQLKKAGIELTEEEVQGIEQGEKNEFELYIPSKTEEGKADARKTRKLERKVEKIINWGGYKTGYGGIILQKAYQAKGDWNDKSSAHHY